MSESVKKRKIDLSATPDSTEQGQGLVSLVFSRDIDVASDRSTTPTVVSLSSDIDRPPSSAAYIKQVAAGPKPATNGEVGIPRLKARLRPHQVKALRWMQLQEKKPKEAGGLLADDMGLGKTVEALALICSDNHGPEEKKPTLIVVTQMLVAQWQAEITKHAELEVRDHLQKSNTNPGTRFRRSHVTFTTYTTLAAIYKDSRKGLSNANPKNKKDDPIFKHILYKIKWHRIILDEAHLIRTMGTQTSEAVRKLDSAKRWCMTGTPIYNGITDVFPYFLFIRNMTWNDFRNQILRRQMRIGLDKLRSLIEPIMLRRTKEDLLELTLPSMSEKIVDLDFSPAERYIYDRIEQEVDVVVNPYFPEQTTLKSFNSAYGNLMLQRQATCHPAHLVLNRKSQAPDPQTVSKPLGKMEVNLQANLPKTKLKLNDEIAREHGLKTYKQLLGDRGVPISTKMQRIGEIIDEISAKDPSSKTLIYSNWRLMLDATKQYLEDRGVPCLRLKTATGTTFDPSGQVNDSGSDSNDSDSDDDEQAGGGGVMSRFNDPKGPKVMLMTPMLGGVGLNLTAANNVIVVDPSWSPSTERQAMSRVHRMGQTRDVTIWRLVMKETTDENIMRKQKFKNNIILQVVEGKALEVDSSIDGKTVEEVAEFEIEPKKSKSKKRKIEEYGDD